MDERVYPAEPVYYDYGSDTAFVGDNAGMIHQFSGVFKGPPAEVTSGGWPVNTIKGNILTSAVHDPSSGNTFVGDSGGFLYRVDGTGTVFTSRPRTGHCGLEIRF